MNPFCLHLRLKLCFIFFSILAIMILSALPGCGPGEKENYTSWEVYRGDDGSNAYSRLDQINTKNVNQLKVAWTYRTGDKSDYFSLQCNPIIINDILYGLSPKLKIFALNAKTGKPVWVFDPFSKDSKDGGFNRGLTYWRDGNEQRIIIFVENKMIALDTATGKQIMDFGENGYVDLHKGLRELVEYPEDVRNTSPAIVFKDLIITGSPSFDFHGGERIGQNLYGNSVIAINAATGKYIWHYQVLHHDLWDYDLPAPSLVTAKKDKKLIDAVAQITKQGFVFLFDRETGTPLFPIEEKPVAVSKIPEKPFGNSSCRQVVTPRRQLTRRMENNMS